MLSSCRADGDAPSKATCQTHSNFVGLNNFPDTITIITSISPTFGISLHSLFPKTSALIFLGCYLYPTLSGIHHLATANTHIYSHLAYWSVEKRIPQYQRPLFLLCTFTQMPMEGIWGKYLGSTTTPLWRDSFQKGSKAKEPVIPNMVPNGCVFLHDWCFSQEVQRKKAWLSHLLLQKQKTKCVEKPHDTVFSHQT